MNEPLNMEKTFLCFKQLLKGKLLQLKDDRSFVQEQFC